MKRNYEKPQPKNPHQLTVAQHIIPQALIERFANRRGLVRVVRKRDGTSFPSAPDNPLFCALRVWDEWAERGFMAEVENEFWPVAEKFQTANDALSSDESEAVARMFFLWVVRFRYRDRSPEPIKLKGVQEVSVRVTKDEEERLEKARVATTRPDATIAAHHIYGPQMFLELQHWFREHGGKRWAVFERDSPTVVFPDAPGMLYLPVSPTRFFANSDLTIGSNEALDAFVLSRVREWYFRYDPTA